MTPQFCKRLKLLRLFPSGVVSPLNLPHFRPPLSPLSHNTVGCRWGIPFLSAAPVGGRWGKRSSASTASGACSTLRRRPGGCNRGAMGLQFDQGMQLDRGEMNQPGGSASTGPRSTPAAASMRSWTSTRSRLAACRLGAWNPPPGGMGHFQGENMKRLIRVLLFASIGLLLAIAIVFIGGIALGDNPIFHDVTLDLTTLIRGIPPGVYILTCVLLFIHLIHLWDTLHFDAMNKRHNQFFEAIGEDSEIVGKNFEIAGEEIEKLWDRLRELEDEISDLRQ